tara:strand:- start:3833 stop:5677 length:1845 start_codon:yes stop_codon:yes gene_type:complete
MVANDTPSPKNKVISIQNKDGERVFVIQAPTTDLDVFRKLVQQAARLKPYGKVEVNISELAEKSFHEIPEGRNFWYEYASYNPTPFKFFPDSKIEKFIPVEFVKRNRELLLAKAGILREFGLGAAFWSYEPNFLPEEFYNEYPQLRGARVDHPRRGNYPAFSPCVSLEETQEMYGRMVAELLKNVPEINTFFFKTNDAGSGICWADWLYTGPNGPSHCKGISTGRRVAALMNSFKRGAKLAGREITIHLTGSMFSDEEKIDIYENLPPGCYYQSHNSDEVKGISSQIVKDYPIKGVIEPVSLIRDFNSLITNEAKTTFISFRASYDRDHEDFNVIQRFVDVLIDYLSNNKSIRTMTESQQLYVYNKKWAGDKTVDELQSIFLEQEKASNYKSEFLKGASGIYMGVSARYVTRPLVVAPDRLAKADEAYFMQQVFNANETEARMDYVDIHGAVRIIDSQHALKYAKMLYSISDKMSKISHQTTDSLFLGNMSKALKIQGSIYRSIGNFSEAQLIRNRNIEKFKVQNYRPNKNSTWEGDKDLQAFNMVMRDELDNTTELIETLENNGMDYISHSDYKQYEDTFLLGPDLIQQLKKKRKIMLEHWRDIEDYMATPLK